MKFCILGPVETKSCFGGVSTFDIGLALALKDMGQSVFLATDQKDFDQSVDYGVPAFFVNRRLFKTIIKQQNPDYIITELGYAKYVSSRRKTYKTIYYLHAFFKQSYYGLTKSILAVAYQKFLLRKCDYIISNSYFTEMINKDFFGIDSDGVIHVGVTKSFLDDLNKKTIIKEKKSLFFAGRFVPAKGALDLLKALKLLKESGEDIRLYLAGDGPQNKILRNYAVNNNLNVVFLGRLDQRSIVEYYLRCETFVSLDISEPFGIVFSEALICGCKIICPNTGGQVESLLNYSDSVTFSRGREPNSISESIINSINNKKAPRLTYEEKAQLTYEKTAKELLSFVRSKQ